MITVLLANLIRDASVVYIYFYEPQYRLNSEIGMIDKSFNFMSKNMPKRHLD